VSVLITPLRDVLASTQSLHAVSAIGDVLR
jgi:hypothetical protein